MTKGKQQQISIELDEKVGSGEYANFVVITHSPAEFVFDFTRLLPGMPKAKVNARTIMAPPHAKAFLNALKDNLSRYEKQYGEITVPEKEALVPFGVKPPEGSLPN